MSVSRATPRSRAGGASGQAFRSGGAAGSIGSAPGTSASRAFSPRLRCAIYTRKSTEEGLDQAFNSLDAQREACAAFIVSQAGLGWKLLPGHYDDGGISGGTMERPALQRLLQDIRDRQVDVVVVYKIDRLTRSLADFAKIVEVFDANGVSFVSVTQQFNTTTSMGRLTLNVLLSFAQFEREVTAERIRDKIAASRKKGMWMGGTVPVGYRVENRKLVIDEAAAAEVRMMFERYLELGSVPALARELNGGGEAMDKAPSLIHADTGQGRRRPAKTVSKGKLYYMLANPLYIGWVRHGGETYAGEHQPIIADDLFQAVQSRLTEQAPRSRGIPVQRDVHLLNGLLFDETGDRLSPIHARKAGKRYRYYISSRLKAGRSESGDGWRIPAMEIETIVIGQLKKLLCDKALMSSWMHEVCATASIEVGLAKAEDAASILDAIISSPEDMRAIIHMAIRRIDLAADRIRIAIDMSALADWLVSAVKPADLHPAELQHSRKSRSPAANDADHHIIDLPLAIRKRGIERRLVIEGPFVRRPDRALIDMIARAHAYLDALTDGQGIGRKDVAERFDVHPEDVSRLLPLAFLSPRIVEVILAGRQPADLSVRHLARDTELPMNWADQDKLLGM
jgi:DNA invertase Pin-like site-specific DNA recombinase